MTPSTILVAKPAEADRGVKSSVARRPYDADTIFLKTLEVGVEIYFFAILQFAKFTIWLGGDE